MKSKSCKVTVLVLVATAAIAVSAAGEDIKPFGIIFNTGSILLELESYQTGIGDQTGVGIKIPGDTVHMRYSGEIYAANNNSTIHFGLGATLEKHFRPGQVSPYIGGFAHASFFHDSDKEEPEDDTWKRHVTVPLSVGGLLGIEYFLLDNLSVFAEYALAVEVDIHVNTTSTAGIVEPLETYSDIRIDSRLGNNSKIGIVIYVK